MPSSSHGKMHHEIHLYAANCCTIPSYSQVLDKSWGSNELVGSDCTHSIALITNYAYPLGQFEYRHMPRPFLLPCEGSGSETSLQQDLACSCADENIPIAVDAQAACEWMLIPSPAPNLSSRLHVALGEALFRMARLYIPPRGEERSGNLLIPFWFRDFCINRAQIFVIVFNTSTVEIRLTCIVSGVKLK